MHLFILHAGFAGLVRRTWILTAITVVSCAAFAARAATSIMTADYLGPSDRGASFPQPAPPSRAAPPAPPHLGPEARLLVERNLFCSSCTPAAAGAPGAPGAPGATSGFQLPPAVLIETSLGPQPWATVHVLASDVQGSWGLGDAIPGLGALDRIGSTWIEVVDAAGHRGRLSLLALAEPAAGRGSDTATSASPTPADALAERIRKLDDQNYEVDRTLVRELVTSASRPGGMRFVPRLDHGEIRGVRIYGVTAASVPAALGLRNGDSLEAIDGAPLKDVNQLLELYAKLDQLSAVELSGTRAGQPLARTLRLR